MALAKAVATIVLAAGLVGTAAGCTSASNDTGRTAPKPTATSGPQAVTQKCVDDFMLIDADQLSPKKTTTITQPCGTMSIVGTGGHLEIASASRIIVEGNANAITVKSVATVIFAGNDNSVSHAGVTPQIDDKGSDNVVTATD